MTISDTVDLSLHSGCCNGHTLPRQARILIALDDEEEAMFFPSFPWEQLPAEAWLRFNPGEQDASEWEQVFRSFSPTVIISCWSTPPLPDFVTQSASRSLRYVCHVTGSVRQVIPMAFIESGGLVTNWGSLASIQVAEHALLLILATLRNQTSWRRYIRSDEGRHSAEFLRTRTLVNQRVGLHGCGRIARQLIALMRPFNVDVYCYSEGVPREMVESGGATACESLQELFATSDILVECEALTPQSEMSVTREMLELLPNGAVFVNVGRGRVVDEAALVEQASSGRIRVATDVAWVEPAREEHALVQCPSILFSPHIGGPTYDRFPACGKYALRNIERFVAGLELESLVDLDTYNRST